ncbi:hypothetical protein [Cellulosimicrobium arenosum]|uniref:Uncharacterized protein n=1 Tax=Cellulosimicrobium arenosum TaxID=2708133 RepID=A0A927J142_9MICO|nr:hypothetical protein [Cellulosimicrobium arenosum]MBD8079943.1 hypothetical protein [Cellulosimicrobium arenosum]
MTQPTPTPGVQAPQPGRRRRTVSPTVVVGIVAGAVVLLVVLAVGARAVLSATVFSAGRPVVAYLETLGAGDAEAALAMSAPGLSPDQSVLLTNEVYGEVEARPSSPHVDGVQREDGTDRAFVTVTWDEGGQEVFDVFTVRRAGRELVLFDRWELVPPPVSRASLPRARDLPPDFTVVVDGVEVAPSVGSDEAPWFAAFPGRYDVTLPDGGPFLEAPTVPVLVGGPGDTSFVGGVDGDELLRHAVTDAALEAAATQVTQSLDACVASADAAPEGCGEMSERYATLDLDPEVDVEDFAWELTDPPLIVAERDGHSSSTGAPPTITVTVEDGTVEATATLRRVDDDPGSGSSPRAVALDDEVALDYEVRFEVRDGELVEVDDR